MGMMRKVVFVIAMVVVVGVWMGSSRMKNHEKHKEVVMAAVAELSQRLGMWAMPCYVVLHTMTLALCLPIAVAFEAGASMLFGFIPGVICVFSAKIFGASLSFFIGRILFRRSSSTMQAIRRNKYFHIVTQGVARDGWRFVMLARFSPAPSYVINYALAATDVRFFIDFLLPTVIGCIPMILQNTSIGSLTSAAVNLDSNLGQHQISKYLFPMLGILSSLLISVRLKKYASELNLIHEGNCYKDEDKKDK